MYAFTVYVGWRQTNGFKRGSDGVQGSLLNAVRVGQCVGVLRGLELI